MKAIYRLLLFTQLICAIPNLASAALPRFITNDTFFLTVTNSNFTNGVSAFTLILADNSGISYAQIGNGPSSVGTYVFTNPNSAGRLVQSDSVQGLITNTFTYLNGLTGTFGGTNAATVVRFGTFALATGQAPVAIGSQSFTFTILNGSGTLTNSGTFSLATDLSDTNFLLSASPLTNAFVPGTASNNPAGNYVYTVLNGSAAKIMVTDTNQNSQTVSNRSVFYLGYFDSSSGTFVLQNQYGFQTGTFTVTNDVPAIFFTGQISLGKGVYFLQFPNGTNFGYYSMTQYPYIYHYDLGWDYFFDANDGLGDNYFYDLTSGHFFYTGATLFPYLYDFTVNSWLYYYPNPGNPQRYTSFPRYFYNFNSRRIFTQ